MRKFFAVLMATIMLAVSVPVAAETTSNIDVIFNRVHLVVNNVATDTTTLLYDGRTYIQLAGAATAFNAALEWDSDTNTAYLVTSTGSQSVAKAGEQEGEESKTIGVMFDRVKLNVNGNATDTATLLYDGRTYIQLAGASTAFNAQLNWDGATNTAYLSTDVSIPDVLHDDISSLGAQIVLEMDNSSTIMPDNSFVQSEDEFYFRDTVWGMTKDDVKAVETLELIAEDSETLTYSAPIDDGNEEFFVYYFDSNGELYYGFSAQQWSYDNASDYLFDYQNLRVFATEELGEPYSDNATWLDSVTDFDSYNGSESYSPSTTWGYRTDNSAIMIFLIGEDNMICLLVAYYDITRF